MDNSHNIKNLDLLYLDAKKLVNEIVTDKIDEKLLLNIDKTTEELKEQWHGKDGIVQINKMIEIRNILIDNRDIIGNIGVYISMLAKNYRDAQNINGVILPTCVPLTYTKLAKTDEINSNSQEIYMDKNIKNTITNLNNIISSIEELNELVSKTRNSIFDNWLEENEHRAFALKKFEKYFENSSNMVNTINNIIKCINKSIDSYDSSKNAISSMPSLETMFENNNQAINNIPTEEQVQLLNSINKNIDDYTKLSDKFNDVLVNEVKKDLISKGIIE